MKKIDYIKSFQEKELVKNILKSIEKIETEKIINIMEICGGHTHSIQQYGLDKLLAEKVNFLSGPGCPVCVTPIEYIDKAIELSKERENIILTFGDIIRVRGTKESLEIARSKGADVRIFYSPFSALEIAKKNNDKKIIFLAIGFETTTPLTAQLLEFVRTEKIKNFFVMSAHKTIIEPMEFLLLNKNNKIDAFICPGHVSTIIGSDAYKIIREKYNKNCVITGFEPVDILNSVYIILKQIKEKKADIINTYNRVVKYRGNKKAQELINKYFVKCDSIWRGIGEIKNSGLEIKDEFKEYRIKVNYTKEKNIRKEKGCICGLILQGIKKPTECLLFAKICNPENPAGACMVSSEGACAAYYKYSKITNK